MTRSKPYLRNSVKRGPLLNTFLVLFFLCGCSFSSAPTYRKENITEAIQNICKKEYGLEVKARLSGSTLWIYQPLEDIFEKSDKPERYLERFQIKSNNCEFSRNSLRLEYMISKVNEREKFQDVKFSKGMPEKLNNPLKALRRVIFSMERTAEEPKFYCLVSADIKQGFDLKQFFYYQDFKKVSYEFISAGEFRHRSVQTSEVSPLIIGDKQGEHLDWRDISFEEFIAEQIKYRIDIKFGKSPEVGGDVDIDREIIKIIKNTLDIYKFNGFTRIESNNLLTGKQIVFNGDDILKQL